MKINAKTKKHYLRTGQVSGFVKFVCDCIDNIKADIVRFYLFVAKIVHGGAGEALALLLVHRGEWTAIVFILPGFDFNENQRAAVPGDHVELVVLANPHALANDFETLGLERLHREPLAPAPGFKMGRLVPAFKKLFNPPFHFQR